MNSNVQIYRASRDDLEAARHIVNTYCEEIGVLVRDTPADFEKYFADDAGIWLAAKPSADGATIVGCVILRPLPAISEAGEVKRLYVMAENRGERIAHQLLEALHVFATERGYRWMYLDTRDDLTDAIRFYERRGYEACERYNDNPQATIFMRKKLK